MAPKPKRKLVLSLEDSRVRYWILKHRGVLAQVSVKTGHSHQYVQAVAYGKSTSRPGNDVELELRRRGWPGIRRKDL